MALPCVTAAGLNAAPPALLGKASGTLNTLQQFGAVFGVAIVTAVFNSEGSLAGPAAVTSGYRPALAVAAGLSVLGAAAALGLRGRRPNGSRTSLAGPGRRARAADSRPGPCASLGAPVWPSPSRTAGAMHGSAGGQGRAVAQRAVMHPYAEPPRLANRDAFRGVRTPGLTRRRCGEAAGHGGVHDLETPRGAGGTRTHTVRLLNPVPRANWATTPLVGQIQMPRSFLRRST